MLTTEHVIEVVSKVSGTPTGFFAETSSRERIGIAVKTLWCDIESDEYTILMNSKEEIIEIKNSYHSWSQTQIQDIINPKSGSPEVMNNASNPTAQQAAAATPQTFTNLPPAPAASVISVDEVALKQYIVDFVKLNPGCISTLFHPTLNINEMHAHSPSDWAIEHAAVGVIAGTAIVRLLAINSSDPDISGRVNAELIIDFANNTVLSCTVQG